MKFYPLTATQADASELQEDRNGAREIGRIGIGEKFFFFRHGLKTYYIPYGEIRRYFRRVQLIPAKMCCGRGDFEIENLVLYSDEGEIAQIQLPGTRAGKALMEILREKAPDAICGKEKDGNVSEEEQA